MSDEKAHREKEAEKAKVETRNQTKKASEKEMSDKEAHYEKENEKVKKDEVGTWNLIEEKLPLPEVVKRKPGSSRQSSQQTKLVLRYSCDVCQHVSKTTEQLKKHTTIAHKGHKNTTWMFCGDCEYATRMEEEMIGHLLKEEAEKVKEREKKKEDEKEKKGRKANHSESSDEGYMEFTPQARNEVTTIEEGMTYAEYRANVDWETPEHVVDHDVNKSEDWDNEFDDSEHNPADNEGFAKCEVDLWQVKYGTIPDKLTITDDPAKVKKASEEPRAVTKEAEKKTKDEQEEEGKAKADEEAREGEDDENVHDMGENEEDDIPEDENEEANGPDMGLSVSAPVECATHIRGLNQTDTQVHSIASRLSIRAVDREEQTVEGIKASTGPRSVPAETNEPEETKEEENVSIAEDAPGCKMREEDDKADEAPDAETYGEKEIIFLSQAKNGDADATQFLDKNWMVGGADDSHTTSCLCLYEYDRYVTTNNNETSRKGRERVDQFTYEKYRQAGTMKAQAIEKNPVQFSPKRWYRQLKGLTHYNKGEDSDSDSDKMFKDKDEEEMAILDTGCAGAAAGRKWVEDHIENLCPEDKTAVRRREGKTFFKFGSGMRYKSQQRMLLPVYFADRRALMAIDMIDLHLPLLISLPAMKKAKTVIYTATDTVTMYGQHLKLGKSNGHYTLSLRKGGAKRVAEESTDEENSDIDEEDLENLMEEDPENLMVEVLVELGSWKEEIAKVHSQMCHAFEERTKSKLEERQARHEDHTKARKEDERESKRKADVVNQENDKQDEDELRKKEDEITKERVRRNSTGGADAGFAETSPIENVEKDPADGVVVDSDAAKRIRLDTERVIKQAVREKPNAYHKLRDIVGEVNGLLSPYSESGEHAILSHLARDGCGASSQYGAYPTQKSSAQVYSGTYGEVKVPEFARRLWGDIYLTSKIGELAKKALHGAARRNLGDFNPEPLHELFAQVGENGNKSLSMLCEQLGIRLTKDEMMLGSSSSRFLVEFSGSTSMCKEHIPSPAENAKQKVVRPSETERYEDLGGYDQDERLMVHTNRQHTTEDTTYLQMLERFMSGVAFDEMDSRYRKVGRLWVYEARYRMDENMVSASTWIMTKGMDKLIMKTTTLTDMQGEEESGEHDLRKCYPEIEIRDLSVPLRETVKETLSMKCFEEAPNKKNKMMMYAEPREKGPGEETKKIQGLEMKPHSKKTEEYKYIEVCKEQPREILEQGGIQPLCDTQDRMVRTNEINSFTFPAEGDGKYNQCWTNVGPEEHNREKSSNSFIILAKEHKYRFEQKMIYELEMKTCPKKTKKDSHTKDYKEQPRVISDQDDIQPLCDTQERMVYIYEINSSTLSSKKQIHHSEPKMIYELEMKNRSKKIKKDDYIKDCKEQPRVISDQCDTQPLRDTQERMVRIYGTNSSTLSAKKQIYRSEPKMIHELEMKTRSKKIKKGDYIKDCEVQPRVICDQCDSQPGCDTQERMVHADETNRK